MAKAAVVLDIESNEAVAGQGGLQIPRQRNQRDAKALQELHQSAHFLSFPAGGDSQDDIPLGNHPDVSVNGLSWVEKA
jgi:hypothetical protein